MSRLSRRDATLVAAQAEAQAALRAGSLRSDDSIDNEFMYRWAFLVSGINETPADTVTGIVAKARTLLDEIDAIVTEGEDKISIRGVESLCNDIVKLLAPSRGVT